LRPLRLGLMAFIVMGTLVGGASIGSGATTTCIITPTVRETMVNQSGLKSTSGLPLRIVRGKQTLFKVFLSMPATLPGCAGKGAAIQIVGATVNVTGGGLTLNGSTPIQSTLGLPPLPSTYTYPTVATSTAAPALDSSGDPKFIIPGSVLAPSGVTGQFTATFSASITYQSKGTSTGTYASGPNPVSASASATVEAKSNIHAVRILATPMGLPTFTSSQNFSDAAVTATQSGFAGLAAKAPVQDGIGDLLTGTGGLRYTLNRNALVDVSGFLKDPATGLYPSTASGAKLCLRTDNFGNALTAGTIAAQVAGQLAAWNSANGPTATNPTAPDHTADFSFGLADALQSLGGANSCYEGLAAVGGRQTAARVAAGSGSITPAVLSMEWAHNTGLVPVNRDDDFNPNHSPYVTADNAPGDLSRVYNPSTENFVSDNHTVMDFTSTWNGDNTVYENADYEWLFCALGGTATTECLSAVPSPLGTTTAVAAGPTYYLAGTTDGATIAGTHLVEVHPSGDSVRQTAPTSSHYYLTQINRSTGAQSADRVAVTFGEADAGDCPDPGSLTGPPPASCTSNVATVNAAVPQLVGADQVIFSRGLPGDSDYAVLYSKSTTERGAQPQISSVSTAQIPTPNLKPGASATFTSQTFHTASAPTGDEDVVFLFDTTASMGGAIDNAKSKATDILNAILASDPNAQFAVASYKDFNFGATCTGALASSYVYKRGQNLTSDTTAVKNAITALDASGGCDTPEADFLGLREIAAGSDPYKVTFRDNTRKDIIWVGDAPSHSPICKAIASTFDSNITEDIDEASVISALSGIKVFPVSIGDGLNSGPSNNFYPDTCTQNIPANQGSDIATATGGKYQTIDASDVSGAILRALGRSFRIVPTVKSCDPGASLSFSPSQTDAGNNTDVNFSGTFGVASSAKPGSQLTCTYAYLVNGVEQGPYTVSYYVADFSGAQGVTVNVTGNTLVDVYVTNCPGDSTIHYPVRIGLTPQDGVVTTDLDASQCPGGTAEATVNDPFTQTSFVDSTAHFASGNVTPQVAIQNPTTGATVLRYKNIVLRATALPAGATIQWKMDGANLQPGGNVNVPPPGPSAGNPKGGWTSSHVFTVTATYGGQTSSEASVTVTAIADTDGDGMPDSFEQSTTCFPAGSDQDPLNAYADSDGDGISNLDEYVAGTDPCVAETSPLRATIITVPQPIDLSSTSAKFSVSGILEQYRPMTDIDAATVRLKTLAGFDVLPGNASGNPDFPNIGWLAKGQIGAAVFDYQKLIAFLNSKNIQPGTTIVMEIVGASKSGISPPWSFDGFSSVKVIKS
jgi:Bacterial TSP3 repeat